MCSIWLPLDRIPKDNCLEFVAGSHRWPMFAPFFFSTGELYPEYKDGSKVASLLIVVLMLGLTRCTTTSYRGSLPSKT